MAEQVIRLLYPPALRNVPIMNALISNYTELTVNILQAKVSSVESWLEIQLVGNAPLIENAISWLRDQGIAVETLSA